MCELSFGDNPVIGNHVRLPFGIFKDFLYSIHNYHRTRFGIELNGSMPLSHAHKAFKVSVVQALTTISAYRPAEQTQLLYYVFRHYPLLTDNKEIMEDLIAEVIEPFIGVLTSIFEDSFKTEAIEWATWRLLVEERGSGSITVEICKDYRIIEWEKLHHGKFTPSEDNFEQQFHICYPNGQL